MFKMRLSLAPAVTLWVDAIVVTTCDGDNDRTLARLIRPHLCLHSLHMHVPLEMSGNRPS